MDFHTAKCRSRDQAGLILSDGPCRAGLDQEHLVIEREGQPPLALYYSDIDQVLAEDHAVALPLWNGPAHTLYFLGRYYDQFVSELRQKRSFQLIPNLLMLDADPGKQFRGAYRYAAPDGHRHADRACRITLFRSSLVVEAESQDPWNLAYNDIVAMRFNPQEYALELQLDLGEQIAFSMLGTRFGELEQEIRRLIAALQERTARLLTERLPESTPQKGIAALASVLRQGKAVPRPTVQAAAPGLWPELEALLFTGESGEVDGVRQAGFAHLCSMAAPEQIYVGLREPYESTAENPRPLFWFVIAYPERQAMAVEVTNESGYATYLYRIEGAPEVAVRELTRGLVALNFRREVISAGERELESGRMARYQAALRKLPYVQRLRQRFLGRVAHTTEEAWRRGIAQLLERP